MFKVTISVIFVAYLLFAGETLLLNKPLTWTSFDVVKKIRWKLKKITGIKKIKVGHAGTLDPLATGLLIICTGKFAKKIDEYQGQIKEYTGTIALGASRPSYDKETDIDHTYPITEITEQQIIDIAKTFLGESLQTAPIYSALKVDGERAYEKARRGEEIEMKKRLVNISNFEVSNIRKEKKLLLFDFTVECSKGTYIRAIARDFGVKLKNGGYLDTLCRTKIGDFSLEKAYSITDFSNLLNEQYPDIIK
jgi:tRNA pseudouridine55 synthase